MFGKNDSPGKDDAKVESVKLYKTSATDNNNLTAVIMGDNLTEVSKVDVNGGDCSWDSTGIKNKSLIRCTFTNLGDKKLFITLLAKDKALQPGPLDNPFPKTVEPNSPPDISKYSFDSKFLISQAEFQNTQEIPYSTDMYVVVKLTGIGFTEKMRVDKGILEFISPTEAQYKIEKSKTPLVITIIDDENKLKAKKDIIGEPHKPRRKIR
jgi:hypothetical protein